MKAKVTKVHRDYAVTKYEVYPDMGVKVSKIVSLSDDLALALAQRTFVLKRQFREISCRDRSSELRSFDGNTEGSA